MPYQDNYSIDKEIFRLIQLNKLKEEYNPFMNGMRLIFTWDQLSFRMKEMIHKKYQKMFSFEEFLKDYEKNRIKYILMRKIEEHENG